LEVAPGTSGAKARKESKKLYRSAEALRHPKAEDKFEQSARENTMHDAATHDFSTHDSKGQYFWVWGALLVLTGIEVWLGYKQIFEPVHMIEVLLVLSIIKSALIIGYFMHLKFEKALMRWMLVFSVMACFIIMYFFFFPDAGRILKLGVH
jgi:caa(3)-type oxidase subunit IV